MYYTYPIAVVDGDIKLHDDDLDAVGQAIVHCLRTGLEERVMRPEYGFLDVLFQGATLPEMRALVVSTLEIGLEGFNVVYDLEMALTDGSFVAKVTYADNVIEVRV